MKNTGSLTLTRLIYVYFKSLIYTKFREKTAVKLPAKVGKYRLINQIEKIGTVKAFELGMYKNPEGQKAIAKIWTGRFKDFNYYALKNELEIYKILNNVLKRNFKNLPEEFSKMKIPSVVVVKENEDSLVILIKYINGTIAENLSSTKKTEIYFKVTGFLNYLGSKLTEAEKSKISRRSSVNYIILYPLLLTKAVLTHPRVYRSLIKGIPVFLKSIPVLLSENSNRLIHRDLHFRNIIVDKKEQIFLIDFQLCARTLELYENITTLRYLWREGDITAHLLKKLKRNYSSDKNFKKLFKGLAVNSATHGLTGKDFTREKIDKFTDFLNFGVKY